jgi:hypothetical protein
MEYDPSAIPERINNPDTPDSIQECLKLRSTIEFQLDDWCSALKSTHPSIASRGIAVLIVSNCTPKERSNDDIEGNPFEIDLTPKEIEQIKQQRERLDVITSLAQNNAFDSLESSDDELNEDPLQEYFERAMSVTENPNNPQTSRDAVRYLRRIHIAEDHITNKIKEMVYPNSQNYKYILLLERIFYDL